MLFTNDMKTIKNLIAVLAFVMFASAAASAQTVLSGLNGERVDIQGQDGKVVILAVGASWLPLSAKQIEYTNRLAKMYAGRNVAVYFVATDSENTKSKNFATNEDIKRFAAANKLAVPVLRDSDGAALLKKFSIDQLPSFVVLDKSGNMSGDPFGGIDPKYDISIPISKAVDKLL